MVTNTKPTESEKLNGLFVRAVVMSSTAKALKRKSKTLYYVAKWALLGGLLYWVLA